MRVTESPTLSCSDERWTDCSIRQLAGSDVRVKVGGCIGNEGVKGHARQRKQFFAHGGRFCGVLHFHLLICDGKGAGLLRIDRELEAHAGIIRAVALFGEIDALQLPRHRVADLEARQFRRRSHVVRRQHVDPQRRRLPDHDALADRWSRSAPAQAPELAAPRRHAARWQRTRIREASAALHGRPPAPGAFAAA